MCSKVYVRLLGIVRQGSIKNNSRLVDEDMVDGMMGVYER